MAHQIAQNTTPATVAIAFDDTEYQNNTADYLANRGFEPVPVEPDHMLEQESSLPEVDVCLLDLNLGGNPGASLRMVERLAQWAAPPKIVGLAPLNDESTRIAALLAGADRCLILPTGLLELEANIRVCLMDPTRALPDGAPSGNGWQLRKDSWELIAPGGGTSVPLSGTEFVFLKGLFDAGDQPLTRTELYRLLGAQPDEPGLNARIDVMVARLRRKSQRHLDVRLPVKTVSGVGHLFAATTEPTG